MGKKLIAFVLLSPWLALLTLFIALFIRYQDPNFIQSFRLRYFDILITNKPEVPSPNIHVVNIDEATLKKEGQFPFPRDRYAAIIEELYKRQAGLVVFNVYMPEKDRFNKDEVLAELMKKVPVVLPHMAAATGDTASAKRPGVSEIGNPATEWTVRYPAIKPNTKVINDAAAGIGIANVLPEIDGVVRRMPLLVAVNGKLYPNLALEVLRVAAGDISFQIKTGDGGVEALRIPKFGKITTDEIGRIWIDWSKKPIEHSYTKLPNTFDNKIVIVGVTASGLSNPVATPVGAKYPHYVQSALLDTFLSGTSISRPDWANISELLTILLIGIIAIGFMRWTHGYVFLLAVIPAGVYLTFYMFDKNKFLFDALYPSISVIAVGFHAYIVKFLVELAQKLQIKKQFGTYLSPDLVEKLQKNPELLKLGGETRELSIMFTDVRGFTSISEHYGADVQGLTKIMNRYMTAMTARIIENKGTLDKYIGDAQMAFWNAPLDNPKHAVDAVKTALAMLGDLERFNDEISQEGVPPFGMGLGINTGNVVVGNMGSDQRFDYTCLGDAVNLASRLEGQSKPYGVKLVLGEETAKQVKGDFCLIELDEIAVKGKTQGVKIYTIIDYPKQSLLLTHAAFLDLYRKQEWEQAIKYIDDSLINAFNKELYNYYSMMRERIVDLKKEKLPKDWDGIYRATSK